MEHQNFPLETILRAEVHGLDVDGFLVNSFPRIFEATNNLAALYGIFVTAKFVHERIMPGTPEQTVLAFEDYLYEKTGADSGYTLAEHVDLWLEMYSQATAHPVAYDGAVEFIHLLRQNGKKVPLITSAGWTEMEKNLGALHKRAAELGIPLRTDAIITYDEVAEVDAARTKPDPLPMIMAFSAMELPEFPGFNRIAYYGDSASDMLFANNLGGYSVLVETNNTLENMRDELTGRRVFHVSPNVKSVYAEAKLILG